VPTLRSCENRAWYCRQIHLFPPHIEHLRDVLRSFAATVFVAALIWADGPPHTLTLTGLAASPTTLSRSRETAAQTHRGRTLPEPYATSLVDMARPHGEHDRQAQGRWPQAPAGFKVETVCGRSGEIPACCGRATGPSFSPTARRQDPRLPGP